MSESGTVTIPLFHCVFNAEGSITHWATTYQRALYDALPHLYLVCLADNSIKPRRIVGAFMIKTNCHHDNVSSFQDVINIAMDSMENLQQYRQSTISFLPARIGITGEPLSEMEFLRLALKQFTKFSVGGTA
jgi:hypothetical protein